MNKYKITYLDYGEVRAKIIASYTWKDAVDDAIYNYSINENSIVRIELVLVAINDNIEDTTMD